MISIFECIERLWRWLFTKEKRAKVDLKVFKGSRGAKPVNLREEKLLLVYETTRNKKRKEQREGKKRKYGYK